MVSVQVLADAGGDVAQAVESVSGHGWEVVVGYVPGREPAGLGLPGVRAIPVCEGARDKVRQGLAEASSHDACLILEPWERLASGHEALASSAALGQTTRAIVTDGDMVTKPVRLWDRRKASPTQAVMECVRPDGDAVLADCTISVGEKPPLARLLPLARAWAADDPLSAQPDYCLACLHLAGGDTDAFWTASDSFLFKARNRSMAVVMTRYHRAMVAGLSRGRPKEAVQNMLACLSAKPLMAEFWCLLGDIFVLAKDNARAAEFYRNAIDFGARRDFSDPWPVQLSKYRDYPSVALAALSS